MSEPITVYTTCAHSEEAARLARCLVEERLIACGNVIQGVMSFYRWEGQVMNQPEAAILMKTTKGKLNQLKTRLTEIHSYDVPCIVAWPIVGCNEAYAEWIRDEVDD